MKRFLDIVLASIGIVSFAPLGALFALLIKQEDKGPIFFVQERWGKEGRVFKAYKFRTMKPGAEREWGMKPAVEHDPRVTRIGRFLRATAMDELPQLFNILKGEMSFVGPRALAVSDLDASMAGFQERHKVSPGLTGPAQIYAPRDASLKDKFRYDLEYVRHPSLSKDLKLLFLSLWITLRVKWESREQKV